MHKVAAACLSLKSTVVLLALGMALVFSGTLAQIEQGIWTVMDQYFRCWIAWIDPTVFLPKTINAPPFRVPFPGGFLIGLLLAINLLAVHTATFKMAVRGRRRRAGLLLLALGILAAAGVMLGWGAAPVSATEGEAFWRVLFRLGRGALVATLLFAACRTLYKQRAGMVLLHAGVLLLLIGEFLTALFAVEATMTLRKGETVDYLDRSQQFELAFTETSHPQHDVVTVVPDRLIRAGRTIRAAALPFDIKVHAVLANSSRPHPIDTIPDGVRVDYPSYAGAGQWLYVAEVREAGGVNGERNVPSVDIELVDRVDGTSLGRYLMSLWFYPNFTGRMWDLPAVIRVADRTYKARFRCRREYLQTPGGNPFKMTLLNFVHEKYEGTQTPKDFSSHVRIVSTEEDVDRELRIWMNNPLRYARRTFYQSGYLPNDAGTVLQVVRNDAWMIPYLACMIVFVGMSAHFVQSFNRYRRMG